MLVCHIVVFAVVIYFLPLRMELFCIYVVYSCSLSPSVGCFMCSLYDVNIYLHIYYKDVDFDYCIKIVVLPKRHFALHFLSVFEYPNAYSKMDGK